ncbi:MAG TPA: type II secretion system protein M [Steroidobacteraceae bacterium]|nr:type II secretion system protein M [Steroidobacteraceae bacterium]
MKLPLLDWYGKLPPRDRRILLAGAVAAGLILILLIVLPLQRSLDQARDHLRQQQQDLAWMQRIGPTLAAAGPEQPVSSGHDSLVVVIDRAARESGLGKALTGSTPAGNDALRVQFENADFNLLVGWLHRLSTQQGLHIEDASITGKDGSGLVNASVQLRPGA